ncbi:hypothetical protein HYPSUDRAFT_90944 [Hypholoma sublateritium FD-334 SS-4]|uniref:Uncharacterized protein n=1 Tax=Hypholoma sublateritium (strain FD-334 SS-4) TaxID=945553 RepID=A0A0D2NK38_HYPSF|nr:hypothetical protein HYPSUDRAFT_90944 [Hypholoma sublateritium FD-334 SS-4]
MAFALSTSYTCQGRPHRCMRPHIHAVLVPHVCCVAASVARPCSDTSGPRAPYSFGDSTTVYLYTPASIWSRESRQQFGPYGRNSVVYPNGRNIYDSTHSIRDIFFT